MGKATEDLKNEHKTIAFVLRILERMASETSMSSREKRQYRCDLVEFLKEFADKCHHGKEENYLFKAMEENGVPNEGGPIGVMLAEHDRGRRDVVQMSYGLIAADIKSFNEAAMRYCELLKSHIDKENTVLFSLADRVLDSEKQAALYEKFEEHEETVIGRGAHEKWHKKIKAWAAAYQVNEDEHAAGDETGFA